MLPRDPLNTPVPPAHCAPALDLNRSRKLAGITLDEIAAATKISLRFLQAIEAEEFEKLPGGIFTTSYLRQYASAIGYDEATLLGHYQRKTNPQAAAAAESRADGESRTLLDRWLRMPAQASR
jgi:cytoskeletal protein RodZ